MDKKIPNEPFENNYYGMRRRSEDNIFRILEIFEGEDQFGKQTPRRGWENITDFKPVGWLGFGGPTGLDVSLGDIYDLLQLEYRAARFKVNSLGQKWALQSDPSLTAELAEATVKEVSLKAALEPTPFGRAAARLYFERHESELGKSPVLEPEIYGNLAGEMYRMVVREIKAARKAVEVLQTLH